MGILRRLSSTLSLVATLALSSVGSSFAETRVALVIGNGAYQNVPRLPNPPNDAIDVAAALKRDGFNTILATDLSRDAMQEVGIRFSRAAREADVAIFYFSGHALQFAGVNYLVPIDSTLNDEADLRRMIRVDEIVSDLQQAKNLRILVLDSCRDNPLADQLKRSIGATRSLPLQRGLAKIDSPQGMIVSYATQAGRTANDGDGRHSPYTAAFLNNIEAQEEIGTIFRRISADVYKATNHEQLPELSLSLIGEFYLRGKIETNVKPNMPVIPSDTTKEDFEATERVDTVGAWGAFLARHPDGYYATLAKERKTKAELRIAALPNNARKTEEPTPKIQPLEMPKYLTTEECSTKYQAATIAGTLNGQKWNDFRKTKCRVDTSAAPTETSKSGAAPKNTIISPSSGTLVFPSMVDPKYSNETAGKGRMHTCVDQYNTNKATNANGGMKWIQKGGGYYSECSQRLKG